MMISSCLVLFPYLTLTTTPSEAQVVEGTVVDDATDRPVDVVEISLLALGDEVLRTTTSDRDGRFILGTPDEGEYRLRAERLGYETVTTEPLDLQHDGVIEVVIRLSSDAIALDPLEVVGRGESEINRATFKGLYQRRARARNSGYDRIFVRGDPEIDTSMTVREFLRLHAGNMGRLRSFGSGIRGCRPSVLYRGTLVGRNRGEMVMNLRLYELEGIEIYRHVENAPPAIRPLTTGRCGFAVIWPRRMGDEPW